jgi:hypothetical protein
LSPQPPPRQPKNAFALPAVPSTSATASVAKAERNMGGLLKNGEGIVAPSAGARGRIWISAHCSVLTRRRLVRNHRLANFASFTDR